jgi:hypothetical protein
MGGGKWAHLKAYWLPYKTDPARPMPLATLEDGHSLQELVLVLILSIVS